MLNLMSFKDVIKFIENQPPSTLTADKLFFELEKAIDLAALTISCSHCGAKFEEKCKTKGGKNTAFHRVRISESISLRKIVF